MLKLNNDETVQEIETTTQENTSFSDNEVNQLYQIFDSYFTKKSEQIQDTSNQDNLDNQTIIIDKKYTNNSRILKQQLSIAINQMIKKHEQYFNKFDKIVMYYDNGQEILSTILESIFLRFDSFEHKVDFNHEEKRLFQISDMLTYIDKYDYKYKNKRKFTKGEKFFFSIDEIRKILKELNKKRF